MKAECPDCPPAHHFSICIFHVHFEPRSPLGFKKKKTTPVAGAIKRVCLRGEVKRLGVKSSAAGKRDFT